jgi:hypothetical protein
MRNAPRGQKGGAGKERASRNACWHGLFSKRLSPTAEQQSEDGEDYELIADGVVDSEPIEFMEQLGAQKIAAELLPATYRRRMIHGERSAG